MYTEQAMYDSLLRGKERLLNQLFRIFAIISLFSLVPGFFAAAYGGMPHVFVIDISVCILIFYFALTPQADFNVRVTVYSIFSTTTGIIIMYYTGPTGAGNLWIASGIIFSTLYRKKSVLIMAFVIFLIYYTVLGFASVHGMTPISYLPAPYVMTGVNILLVTAVLCFIVYHLLSMTQTAIDAERGYAMHMKDELVANQRMRKELSEALAQKSLMLKELNHRVKNNMQVISSLINLTGRTCSHEDFVTILKNRIRSITAVHFLLFSEKDMGTVNLVRLSESIAKYLEDSFQMKNVSLSFNSSSHEIFVHPDRGVNIAIVLNEIITNCYKHAFIECSVEDEEQQGKSGDSITIHLYREGRDIVLDIRDNGCGYNQNLVKDGLGLILVDKLLEQAGARHVTTSSPLGTAALIRLDSELAVEHPQAASSGAKDLYHIPARD